MREMRWAVTAALALSCAGGRAPCVSASDKIASGSSVITTDYYFCTGAEDPRTSADGSPTKPTIYYSKPFMATSDKYAVVPRAFQAFLEDKYHFVFDPTAAQQITCYGLHSMAEAETSFKTYLDRSLKYTAQQAVVETGWTFVSGS